MASSLRVASTGEQRHEETHSTDNGEAGRGRVSTATLASAGPTPPLGPMAPPPEGMELAASNTPQTRELEHRGRGGRTLDALSGSKTVGTQHSLSPTLLPDSRHSSLKASTERSPFGLHSPPARVLSGTPLNSSRKRPAGSTGVSPCLKTRCQSCLLIRLTQTRRCWSICQPLLLFWKPQQHRTQHAGRKEALRKTKGSAWSLASVTKVREEARGRADSPLADAPTWRCRHPADPAAARRTRSKGTGQEEDGEEKRGST